MQTLTLLQQCLAVASGLLVGFTLGLIGGGGSILAVPLLLYLVGYHNAHVAIGTTALAVALTAYINLFPHWKAGNVRWLPALAFALPGVVGAALGAQLGKQLLFLFALLMLVVAVALLRPVRSGAEKRERTGWAMLARTTPVGFVVGLLSGFFGIGGGFLIVPGLMFATGMPLLNGIGTSLFSVGMFGTTTAVTYALSGLVNWPVALEYIGGGILGKQKKTLAGIFAGVIILVAIYMVYVNVTAIHF